jgi:adenylosuccinate synthase
MTLAILCVGLGFGDEGKGSVIDFLTRKHNARLVCRFNGGAQAGHNVVTSDGKHHTFSQFSSGTFAGAETYLSRYMIVNPLLLQYEEEHLASLGITDAYQRLAIDEGALVTTPFHMATNRLRELHREALLTYKKVGLGRHGSCGMGIGETISDSLQDPDNTIRMRDFRNQSVVKTKLEAIRRKKMTEMITLLDDLPVELSEDMTKRVMSEYTMLEDRTLIDYCMENYYHLIDTVGIRIVDQDYLEGVLKHGTTLFEGAQGVLLDEEYGFHPNSTWSNCTFHNALELLKGFTGQVIRMGVTRTYLTRHGAGPFPSEDPDARVVEHNTRGEWQGAFRVGFYDFVLARYAREVLGELDAIALNHLDHICGPQKVCLRYDCSTKPFYKILLDANTWEAYQHLKKYFDEDGIPYTHFLDIYAEPVFTTLKNPDRLISGIAKTMRAPVTVFSYGSTADDKELTCRR